MFHLRRQALALPDVSPRSERGGWRISFYCSTFKDQGLAPYNEMQILLGKISSHPQLSGEFIRNPKIQEMCRMALYDLDRFRRFVLESRFLQLFEVEKDVADRIRSDDVELMRLAHRWLEFGLVAGETLKIREEAVKARHV